jgi:hypothetical protein
MVGVADSRSIAARRTPHELYQNPVIDESVIRLRF